MTLSKNILSKDTTMKISIIIATYNRETLVTRCMDSILGQTFKDFEVLVVDDGSIDGTQQLFASKYVDPRIKYFKFEKNCGQTAARNKGIEESSGELLLIWDSDDELYSDALSDLMQVYNDQGRPDLIYATADFYQGDTKKDIPEVSSGFVSYEERLLGVLPANDVVVLFKREKMGETRFCGANVDSMFYLLFAKESTTYHLNKSLGKIHLNSDENSLTTKRKIPNAPLSVVRAKCLEFLLTQIGDDLKKYNKEKYSANAYGASVGLLLSGEKIKSIFHAFQAVRYGKRLNYMAFFFFTLLPFSPSILRSLFAVKKRLFFKQ
jgi:glycosyltransferase involved in cell wall biosynthesis